ncbi:YihY/virulence factor BrkB family protein [Pseudonocardia benzenivorans]|uniref:YihY/virulence factor BrkB family protein n=1 Tax=Pseudonocardia benzenivorans TaxID=228005 RepID=A0ABW3VRY7_9PSEU
MTDVHAGTGGGGALPGDRSRPGSGAAHTPSGGAPAPDDPAPDHDTGRNDTAPGGAPDDDQVAPAAPPGPAPRPAAEQQPDQVLDQEPEQQPGPTQQSDRNEEPAPKRGAKQLAVRTIVGAWDDNIFSESASAAFWQTLSLPPLLLGLLGSLGYIGEWFGPNTAQIVEARIIAATSGIFTRDAVDQIIAPTVSQILTTGRSELVSLGFVISLWSGSSAMSSFVDAITRAHGQYGIRNPVWQRILALLLYVVALVGGIISLPLLALGPDRLPGILPESWRPAAITLIADLYYPVIGVILVLALTTLYKVALPAKPPWWRGLPGALLAAVVFLAGVTGLRVYINWVTGTGYTYGALAAPIAFLLAAFFIGFAIVLGAHLNASIQALWPARLHDRRGALAAREPAEDDPDPTP